MEHTFCGCVCVGACVCVCVSGGMCAYGDRWVSVCGCACMGSSVNDVCVCVCVCPREGLLFEPYDSLLNGRH